MNLQPQWSKSAYMMQKAISYLSSQRISAPGVHVQISALENKFRDAQWLVAAKLQQEHSVII